MQSSFRIWDNGRRRARARAADGPARGEGASPGPAGPDGRAAGRPPSRPAEPDAGARDGEGGRSAPAPLRLWG